MTPDEYLALMQRALSEPHGLRVTFDSPLQVLRARRKLYKLRAKAQVAGNHALDSLAICARPPSTLLIVPRDKLNSPPIDDGVMPGTAPLSAADVPLRLNRPRGPARRHPMPPLMFPGLRRP